jgi:hypothetical protein
VPGHDGVWAIGDWRGAGPPEALPSWRRWPYGRAATWRARSAGCWRAGHPAVPLPGPWHHGHHRPALGGGRATGASPAHTGWFAWLRLHLLYLAGLRNLSVLLNWLWGYLTWDHGPRIILGPDGKDRR